MLGRVSKLFQHVSAGAEASSDETASPPAKRIKANALPSTQEAVAVIAAQDDVLILRNGAVVAGVGFGSVDDALLAESDIEARLSAYRDMLKVIQFDFQLLIGTRPQNLNAYQAKMRHNTERLAELQVRVDCLIVRMPAYLNAHGGDSDTDIKATFLQHFGFSARELNGIPGGAHEVALVLCDPEVTAAWPKAPPEVRSNEMDRLRRKCEESLAALARWQTIVAARADAVEMAVEALQAPVRTFYFVVSFNPRLLNPLRSGPLDASELERARKELERRCAQLSAGMNEMRLPHWRASQDELLADIRHFYHPAHSQLSHDLSAERSVAMRLASVVR